jgi:hypothetical protein
MQSKKQENELMFESYKNSVIGEEFKRGNLNPIGPNQTELTKKNGIIVLYSYSTPVAIYIPNKEALITDTKYSVTTSRHINHAISRWGVSTKKVEQSVIDKMANE